MNDERQIAIVNAWTVAAKDLGLSIKPFFKIETDDGRTVSCTLLVENFGRKLGTAVFTQYDERPDPAFTLQGYHISILYDSYAKYNRALFAETLDDWAYFGDPELKPDWYTGRYWGQED